MQGFTVLQISCLLGKTKSTLLLLQSAVKEGEACDKGITSVIDKLETMCTYLKPLNGYASKFEKVLSLVKKMHKNLDKVTKFTDNIPKIGQLRKVIVEKVIPMILDILERLNKEVKKIIDYERIILRYKKSFKLIWNIDKKGTLVLSDFIYLEYEVR